MFVKRILIPVAILILIGGFIFFSISKKDSSSKKTVENTVISSTPTPLPLLTWTDEAGFSFQYPEGTNIDKHPEDTKNYANLTLVLPSQDTINILMSDNTFKNLDAWVGQNSAIDTTLEGRPAKKIIKDGQETVACIDNEVLVTITGNDISQVANSWTFIYPSPEVSKNSNSAPALSDSDVLEEE